MSILCILLSSIHFLRMIAQIETFIAFIINRRASTINIKAKPCVWTRVDTCLHHSARHVTPHSHNTTEARVLHCGQPGAEQPAAAAADHRYSDPTPQPRGWQYTTHGPAQPSPALQQHKTNYRGDTRLPRHAFVEPRLPPGCSHPWLHGAPCEPGWRAVRSSSEAIGDGRAIYGFISFEWQPLGWTWVFLCNPK